jgi:hypothetical protein
LSEVYLALIETSVMTGRKETGSFILREDGVFALFHLFRLSDFYNGRKKSREPSVS